MRRTDSLEDSLVDIVHDIKTPLSTIAIDVAVLQHQLEHRSTSGMQAAMSRIARNVVFIDRLVHDLLDSAMIEAGTMSLRREPTDLGALLHRAIERMLPSRDRLRVTLEISERVSVDVDAHRIERVVANLLANALKYSPCDSSVIVRLEVTTTGGACVSVIDAGPGVAAGEQEAIFERLTRGDGARVHDGYGLGLHVSRRIIEAHGGTIAVETEGPIGCRFFFVLPRC